MEFTDEQKEAIQKMIDDAVAKETAGLKAKRDELLGKLKETKQGAEQIAAEKEAAELALAEKAGNIEAVKKQISDSYGKEKAALEAKLATMQNNLHKLVVEDGLTKALVDAGVAAHYLPAAKALLQTTGKIEIGDDLTAKIDSDNLSDYVVKWAQGDAGKYFVSAPVNNGGGAKGANGMAKGQTKTITREEFNKMDAKDRPSFFTSGGKVTD